MVDIDKQSTLIVALLGAPNAGKSTLVNRVVRAKLSIVSPKAQTTRFALRGIRTMGETQLVLVDTPGMFDANERLGKAMVQAANTSTAEADHVLLLLDVSRANALETAKKLLQSQQNNKSSISLVLNKVDKVKKEVLLPLTSAVAELHPFDQIFMLSALKGDGVEDLEAHLCDIAKPGPWLYPYDQLTDINERLFAAELTREQLIMALQQEVPYGLTVDTEKWEETRTGVKIYQQIVVERESHKAIIIGKGGSKLKAIGQAARAAISEQLGRPAHVFLHVKVKEDWKERPEYYQNMGLEF
jgi:GTP-binding protein Era